MDKNIEAFKKMDSNEAIEILFKDNCGLTQRIEKAIEINKYIYENLENMDYGEAKCKINRLSNILKGDDTNESNM